MKKICVLLLIFLSLTQTTFSKTVSISEIFPKNKVKNLLELGVGNSTPYFLESYNKVISIEFITSGYGPENFKHYLPLYQASYNWVPIAFFSNFSGDTSFAPFKYLGSEHMHKAGSYHCTTHLDYAKIDGFFLTELNAFFTTLVKCHKIDAAIVHPAAYIRGDLVNLLFNKAPIIAAEDINSCYQCDVDVYGYYKIKTPENYEEIHLPGNSMTVWIIKNEDYLQLIEDLKATYN